MWDRVTSYLMSDVSWHYVFSNSPWKTRPSKTRPLDSLETSATLCHIQGSRSKVYCYEFLKTNTADWDPCPGDGKNAPGGERVRNWKTVFRNKNTERQKEKEVLGIGLWGETVESGLTLCAYTAREGSPPSPDHSHCHGQCYRLVIY